MRKFLPYILIVCTLTLTALAGVVALPEKADAQGCGTYFQPGSQALRSRVVGAINAVLAAEPTLAEAPAEGSNLQRFRSLVVDKLKADGLDATPSYNGNCRLSPNGIGVKDTGASMGEAYDLVRDDPNSTIRQASGSATSRPIHLGNAEWGFLTAGGPPIDPETPDKGGVCYRTNSADPINGTKLPSEGGTMIPDNTLTETQCGLNNGYKWVATGSSTPSAPITAYQDCINTGGTPESCGTLSGTPTGPQPTYFQNLVNKGCDGFWDSTIEGCTVWLFYIIFYAIPAGLLWISAQFFNVLIGVTIDGALFNHGFVLEAWKIVRDLSNIFFILILVYIGVQTILGISHGSKQMIAQVVIIALIINFSMFFTKVVIDASNILALVFYNKLEVKGVDANGNIIERPYTPIKNEKDVSGGMVSAFDPTTQLGEEFFNKTREVYVNGNFVGYEKEVSTTMKILIILFSGAIMGYTAFILFISGFAFLSRLIELWVLIIFSPFAFMSSTLHELGHIEYIGWDSWLKRLLKTSFMAPIFMFFLYFIFLLIQSKIYDSFATTSIVGQKDAAGVIKVLLGIALPTFLVMYLLKTASDFAKKGSGVLGEAFVGAGKAITGLALGAVTGGAGLALGGAAALGRTSLGRLGALTEKDGGLKSIEAKGGATGWAAARFRDLGKFAANSSFDVRGAKIAGKGLPASFGGASSGSWEKSRADKIKKRTERAKDLEVGEDEALKQNLNAVERDLQALLRTNSHDLQMLDQQIKSAREKASDFRLAAQADPTNAAKQAAAKDAADILIDIKAEKSALKNGLANYTRSALRVAAGAGATATFTGNRTAAGHSINDMEDVVIPDAHHAIETENRNRRWSYAEKIANKSAADKEAAHKIIMEAKMDSGEGHH